MSVELDREMTDAIAAMNPALWTVPPEIYIAPVAGEPGRCYAVVWITVSRAMLVAVGVSSLIARVLTVLEAYAKAAKLKGVEILPRIYDDGDIEPERVLRFTAMTPAIPTAINLPPQLLFQIQPAEGVWCYWYPRALQMRLAVG